MFRRHHAIVAMCCFPVAVFGMGCGEEEKATPQVIFEGHLERGGSGNNCVDTGELFRIGDWGNPAAPVTDESAKPKVIRDGDAFDQGQVGVSCLVKSAGSDEFDVDATVALSGATGGTFGIQGRFKASGDQTGIAARFSSRRSGNTYIDSGECIVRYTTANQGIAAGRLWGDITCPNAQNDGAQTSCEAIAQFRFENCAQE